MKTSLKKSFMVTLTLLALMFSGLGVTPAYAAASFSASPNPWNAGVVNVGIRVDQTISVTNTGDVTFDGSTLHALITGSTDFKVSSTTCSWQWKPGYQCQIAIYFVPTGAGARSATLSVYISGVFSLDIPLSGTGAGPAVSVYSPSWDFGNQTVGATSSVKNFTLTNSGTASLSLGTLSASGEFALSGNTCTGSIAAASTCTFGVTFSPTSTGVKSGSISIPSNAASSPNSVSLTGTGISQAQERAKNGGFNTYSGTSKIPVNWVKNTNFAATDGKDTTVNKEGIASVKIIGEAGKTKTLTQTLTLSGVSGDTFTFTFWAKGASLPTAGICRAQVLLYNGSTLMLGKTAACKTGTYTTFQKKTLTITATSAYTKVVIKFTYSKASGTIWFDLISLMK